MNRQHRDTIYQESAEVLTHEQHPAGQYLLRLHAPETAQRAEPGSFVHLRVSDERPLRRPISIMRADPSSGQIELLYKVFGEGTRLLSGRTPGERVDLLGPIGNPFRPTPQHTRPLLIGGGVGIPPMVFLADHLRRNKASQPLVLMGSEVPFPFKARPSAIMIPGMPEGVIAAMPLLEDWDVASRLASLQGYPGCHEGYVTDLARRWLEAMDQSERDKVAVYACGPHPMLAAVAAVAEEFGLPCQVSMEEFMACGVGGCAGCVVEVKTENGPAMKRVCVDGPVFDARTVF